MELLQCILNREIPLSQVVSDKVMSSSEEAGLVVEHLTRAAIELGVHKVLSDLGQVETVPTDPLEYIPAVRPVTKLKVRPEFYRSSFLDLRFKCRVE